MQLEFILYCQESICSQNRSFFLLCVSCSASTR